MAASNPVLKNPNPTRNGFPLTGEVTLPMESIHYWYTTGGGTTFHTDNGVFQTSATSFDTGAIALNCRTITRKGGSVFTPAYSGTTYFTANQLLYFESVGGKTSKVVFNWGEVTLTPETKTISTIVSQFSSLIVGATATGFVYANPEHAQIYASGVFVNGTLIPTTSAAKLINTTPKTYTLFSAYVDPVKATADTIRSIDINGVTYTASPEIDLNSTSLVKAFIEDSLDAYGAAYGTVSVDYTVCAVNGNKSVLSVTISECDTPVSRLKITIDGTTVTSIAFAAGETSGITVPSSNNYRCFNAFADPVVATADTITGITVGGVGVVFASAVTVAAGFESALSKQIKMALASAGGTCSDVVAYVNPAQANTRKTSVEILILGCNVVVNSFQLNVDAGTLSSPAFVAI